jgi:hypothetical protein
MRRVPADHDDSAMPHTDGSIALSLVTTKTTFQESSAVSLSLSVEQRIEIDLKLSVHKTKVHRRQTG